MFTVNYLSPISDMLIAHQKITYLSPMAYSFRIEIASELGIVILSFHNSNIKLYSRTQLSEPPNQPDIFL